MRRTIAELLEEIAEKLITKAGKGGAKSLGRYFFNDKNDTPNVEPPTLGDTKLSESNLDNLTSILDTHIATSNSLSSQGLRIENNYDNLPFKDAFATAREFAGDEGGHWFKFHDKWYNTYLKEEWDTLGSTGQKDFANLFLQDMEEMKLESIVNSIDWSNIDLDPDLDIEGILDSPIETEIPIPIDTIPIPSNSGISSPSVSQEEGGVFHSILEWISDFLDFDDDNN